MACRLLPVAMARRRSRADMARSRSKADMAQSRSRADTPARRRSTLMPRPQGKPLTRRRTAWPRLALAPAATTRA